MILPSGTDYSEAADRSARSENLVSSSRSQDDRAQGLNWLLDSIREKVDSLEDGNIQSRALILLEALGREKSELSNQDNDSEHKTQLFVNLYDQLSTFKTWETLKSDSLPPETKVSTNRLRENSKSSLLKTCSYIASEFNIKFDASQVQSPRENIAVEKGHQPGQSSGDSQSAKNSETLLEVQGYNIPFSELDWSNRTELSRGTFGIVYETKWGATPVAVKVLHYEARPIDLEFACMKKLHNKYIVELYGTSTIEGIRSPAFVMELCEMSLREYLHEEVEAFFPVPLEFVLDTGADISCGLMFLFCHKIIHRDLKSANILLKQSSNRYHAKICDFGVSLAEMCMNATCTDESPCGTLPVHGPGTNCISSVCKPTNRYLLDWNNSLGNAGAETALEW